VSELDGELALADAAQAGGGRDLAHDRGLPALEGLGQAPEMALAADEVGIAGEGQPRTGREVVWLRNLLEGQARQPLARGGEGGGSHRLGPDVLVDRGRFVDVDDVAVTHDVAVAGDGDRTWAMFLLFRCRHRILLAFRTYR
jgi:hypothetical protein